MMYVTNERVVVLWVCRKFKKYSYVAHTLNYMLFGVRYA